MQKLFRILFLTVVFFTSGQFKEAFSQTMVEKLFGSRNITALRFSSLGAWDFTGNNTSKPPQQLQQMDGKVVQITGFMYPLQEGQTIKVFCLLRSTQTCCYGPKPQFNQYVFVEMKDPGKYERNKSVIITGKFFIDPQPGDGYIYRLEGTKVEFAAEQKPEDKFSHSEGSSQYLEFDFKTLEDIGPTGEQLSKMKSWKEYHDIKIFPENITRLEGKLAAVGAYIVARTNDPQKLIVGKYWWDGCCTGVPPTFFNAIVIILRKGEKIPGEWEDYGIFTGILHANGEKSKWPEKGVIRLEDAVWAASKK